MKKVILMVFFVIASIMTMAQSSDARYPMGEWQTYEGENDSPKYFVSLSISRENTPEEKFNMRSGCGVITISDNQTNKEIFSGLLTYAGKEIKNMMGTGTYYFNVTTTQGKACTISVNGSRTPMIIGTGELKDHPAFSEEISLCPGAMMGTGGETYAMYCETEKELLADLRIAVKDRRNPTVGFGNLQQYINAHAKLNPNKPKYAKPKGTVAVTIRDNRSTKGANIGVIKSNQTLLIVDEFDGWCQVQVDQNKYGWVQLSTVTLTNTPSTK
jgi:hypothetical protein